MSPPRQRILVVEDDPEIRYLLGAILEGEDRDVGCATTGAEALGALEDGAVDVVVLDLILPDVDGRTLLSRIRDSARTAATEVVVVTARTGPEVRQECYALGADAFVEKPFDPEALVAEVSNRLERAARAGAAASRDPLTGLLNRAGLRERCETAGSAGYGLGVLEIDRFGVRSEGWGWDASERVVAAVAEALSAGVAGEVELARLGGGGFALFVAAADEAAITRAADEALAAVRGLDLEPLVGDADPLTGTIGVAAAAAGTPLEEALEEARRRIFQARERPGDEVVADDGPSRDGRARVLVAEDDEISATILLHRLEKEGLELVRFDNGQDAWEAALASPPDLVILDVKMPGLDGFEVLERIRSDARFSSTPVIMLTSMGQEADVVRGFRLGADDYVLKPFSPPELSARVRRLLTRGRSPSAV